MQYDRYCDEIVGQTRRLVALVEARGEPSDALVPLPCCPGWNVGQMFRHLGGVQRWADELVRARAGGPVADEYHGALAEYAHEDLAVVGPWLTASAEGLAAALRAAGPGVEVWTPVPGGTTGFYARRLTHKALVHRADVTLALGGEFAADSDLVVDALDEWMELGALPFHLDRDPRVRELLGSGRTLALHATDAGPDRAGDWLVDLTGDVITWRRAADSAAVTVDAPLTTLLLLVYGRVTAAAAGVAVSGDDALLGFWLERVSFG
jgi:uncharacterized protein (TIGR03083 family)